MKIVAAIIAGLALVSSAQANVLTYQYTAKISKITEYTPASTAQVLSSSMPGAAITIGDTVTGSFSIDSATPLFNSGLDYYGTGTTNVYMGVFANFSGHNEFSARFVQSGLVVQHLNPVNAFLAITDHAPGIGADELYFSVGTDDDGRTTKSDVSINIVDPTGNALASSNVPGTLNGLTSGTFVYKFFNNNASAPNSLMAYGDITSLRPAPLAPVPEPETYGMLLAGVAVLGWTARRRRPTPTV